MGTMPVLMDSQDVGKEFVADIANPVTRERIEELKKEMSGAIGDRENARRIAEAALKDKPLTSGTKKKMADGFVNEFEALTQQIVYEEAGDCTWGMPCESGRCGTKMPFDAYSCYRPVCLDCGKVPK